MQASHRWSRLFASRASGPDRAVWRWFLAKPFDKAERLTWLQQRQREIEAALDLTKSEMAAVGEPEVPEVV